MNVLFTNAVLAPLLALAAVPVLVHLFARSRPKHFVFSSLKFLEPVVRRNLRMKRPRAWLLLLLRTLCVLALTAAFLLPVLPSVLPAAEPGARRNVVLIVDASASMAAIEGARTRFAAAAAQGDGILAGLGSGDRANVIFARALPEPVFPGLAVNTGALRDALRSGSPASETADFSAALALAAGMLDGVGGAREVHVLSDFQITGWEDVIWPEMEGVEVVTVPCADQDVPNQGLTAVSAMPARALAGSPVEILCEVANYSAEPVLRAVFMRSGELVQSHDVRLEPWSRGGTAFEVRFPEAGLHGVEFSTDEDAFPADNRRWLVLEAAPHLTAAVTGADTPVGRAWMRACRAVDWIQAAEAGVEELERVIAGEQPDILLLAGWDGGNAEAVGRFVESGGMVVVAPGAELDEAVLAGLAGISLESGNTGSTWDDQSGPLALAVSDTDHPALAVFEGGRYGNPAGGRPRTRFLPGAALADAFHGILSYEDGVVAIGTATARPGVVLWNVPDAEGTWHERPELIPLLGELLLEGARNTGGPAPAERRAGQRLQHVFDGDLIDEDLEVFAGKMAPAVARTEGKERAFALVEPAAPGLYEWFYQGVLVGADAVNLAAAESDLRVGEAPVPASADVIRLEADVSTAGLREGTPLWPWLVGLAVAAACMEGIIAWKFRESS